MQPGTRLEQYEIVDKLGEGGMGAVYRAQDVRLKRQVAIKVLPPELAADEERLSRLEREAQLLASLNHPNVATVHGFGDVQAEVDGTTQRVTFLVMELVDGESLHARLQAGAMPWREVVEIGIGVAAGLEAAHERGIVHRDLKPANIQVAEDGTVKVLDFGLAKAFESDGTSGSLDLSASPTMAVATQTGMILGTAAYMSPEQARGKSVDKRADVWALGCVLYELLAGHKAFDGETVSDILAAVLREQPDLDALPPIPDSLRHVLGRCLEKHPAQRMRDVGDVRIELEAARDEQPRAATAGDAGSGLSWRAAVAVGVIAALAGAGATAMLRGEAPEAPEARVILSGDAIADGPRSVEVSPDGRWVAEVGMGAGMRLRAMGEIGSRLIPGTAAVTSAAFSADSQTVYLASGGGEQAALHQVAIGGTSPVLVAELPPGFPVVFRGGDGGVFVSSFSDTYKVFELQANGSLEEVASGGAQDAGVLIQARVDETRWLGMRFVSGSGIAGLALIDAAAGTVVPLLPGYRSPLYLGNGRLLAADGEGRLVTATIDVDDGSVVEPPVVRLEGLSLGRGMAGYALSDAGTLVYAAGSVNTVHEEFLSLLSPDGNIETFSERGTEYQVDTFPSPDGRLVAAEFVTDGDANRVTIHVHDIERDVSTPLVPGSNSSFPVWSPDSRRIAYHLVGGDAPGIYSAPVDRSELPTLLLAKPADAYVLPMHWSPDGSALLYVLSGDEFRSKNADLNDLWVLPLDGSDPRPVVATPAHEVDGRFSPDGRWIAYDSDATGQSEIYLRSLAGGGEYRISAGGGTSPEWNPRGGELYFLSERQIHVVDADVSGATPDVSPERVLVSMNSARFKNDLYAPWPDGERFLVATHTSGEEARTIQAIFNWSALRTAR